MVKTTICEAGIGAQVQARARVLVAWASAICSQLASCISALGTVWRITLGILCLVPCGR